MPFVRADDLTVHYDLTGPADAPVVLLVNSLGTNFHLWDAQIAQLARTYRLLRYDMRGHGLTDLGTNVEPPIDRLARDALALLDALGIARVRIAAVSIGGMIAQRLAAIVPERVDAVVLIATGNRLGTPERWNQRIATVEREGVGAVAEGVVVGWFTERTRRENPILAAGYLTMLSRTPADGYVLGCRAVRDADLRADDAMIRAPALILIGAGDPVASPEVGAALRDAIPGARMTVIDGAAHIIPAEQPEATTAALLAFLRETGRAPSGVR